MTPLIRGSLLSLALSFLLIGISHSQSFQNGVQINDNENIRSQEIQRDGQGGLYLMGEFDDSLDIDPSAGGTAFLDHFGNSDVFLAKFDTAGTYQWSVGLGGAQDEEVGNIDLDGNGNIYLTGGFEDSAFVSTPNNISDTIVASSSDRSIFLAKFDTSGGTHWVRSMEGSWGREWGSDVAAKANGDVFLTGVFEVETDFDPGAGTDILNAKGQSDSYLAKYDSSGSYYWAKGIGGPYDDMVEALAIAPNGEPILTGAFESDTLQFYPPSGGTTLIKDDAMDIFMARYNTSGSFLWGKALGGLGDDRAKEVEVGNSGDVFLTGNFSEDLDLDPSGSTNTVNTNNQTDAFIARYNGSCDHQWGKHVGNSYDLGWADLILDGNGSFYVARTAHGGGDFDPSSDSSILADEGLIVSKYAKSSDHRWTFGLGKRTGSPGASGIALDPEGHLHLIGNFSDTMDADPSTNEERFVSKGYNDFFLAEYDTVCVTPTPVFELSSNGTMLELSPIPEIAGKWDWNFGDGNSSDQVDPSHDYGSEGTYTICLNYENDCGTSNFCDTVTVTTSGKREITSDHGKWNIFPNPASDEITLRARTERSVDLELRLRNTLGAILLSKTVSFEKNGGRRRINLEGVSGGLYLVELRDQDTKELIGRKKVIVRR